MTVDRLERLVTSELSIAQDGPVLRLTLNRPEKRNALSRSLVVALNNVFQALQGDQENRVVVLHGAGPAFCAGGDIAEFAEAAADGQAESDANALSGLFAAMTGCPLPIVVNVHGSAYGGGVGLVCAADIAIAAESTRFSLSEARLGLVPAVISPYVIAAMGPRAAKAQMLLASPFDAQDARRCGLIHRIVAEDALDAAVDKVVSDLLLSAPGALATIKHLPEILAGAKASSMHKVTAGLLSDRLASAEGQEGLHAFIEKRPPAWAPKGKS